MNKSPTLVPLVGISNTSEVSIYGKTYNALIDSGSMITTGSESFFRDLGSSISIQLNSLEDFALDISGANDSKVPYLGYILLDISVPSLESASISVPVLIVPDTTYSVSVPLIVGTNVIRHLYTPDSQQDVPDCWQHAFSAISFCQSCKIS